MKLPILLVSLSLLLTGTAGAVVIHFEKDSAYPLVYLDIAFKTGSISDPKKFSGLTDFMAEMLLKGTRVRTKEQLEYKLDLLGSRLSVDTRAEMLVLRATVLSKNLDLFLHLLSEVLEEPRFDNREILKLKNQTIASILSDLSSDSTTVAKNFYKFFYQDHPYGRPVAGTVQEVKTFTREAINRQYRRVMTTDRLVIVGSGDANPEKIQQWANRLGAELPSKSDVGEIPPVHADRHPRVLIIHKPERTQMQIVGGQLGITPQDPEFFPFMIGNYALGGDTLSSRLMQEIRVKRGWSYSVGTHMNFGVQPKAWVFSLSPSIQDGMAALSETLNIISNLQKNGLSRAEFEFAKKSILNNLGFEYDTPLKRMENRLMTLLYNFPTDFFTKYKDYLTPVTLEQVNASLQKVLRPNDLKITILTTDTSIKKSVAQILHIPESAILEKSYTEE